ncbi:MAG: hypothetical protein AAF412_03165, partial [Pseudomonadota bacterium]
GMRAAVEVMGLNFRRAFTSSAVGIESEAFPVYEVFKRDETNPLHTDIEKMRARNNFLKRQLR